MRFRIYPLFGLLLPSLAVAQASTALRHCFGKDVPAYEAILGRKSEHSSGYDSESRIYRFPRNASVTLTKDKGAKSVTAVLILFPRGPMSWRTALRKLGISDLHARVTNRHGYYEIRGCAGLPANWMVWWETDVDGSHQSEIIFGVPHSIIY
jgi:hypothetical protein